MARHIAGTAAIALLGSVAAACAVPAEARQAAPAPTILSSTVTVTTAVEPPPPPPPCGATVKACVDLPTRQAWLLSNGAIAYGPVPISSGAPGSPTPAGTFSVSWKDKENTSSIYHTPMPYSVFFAPGGIAFHEGNVTESSHGCVHLAPDAAPVFFDTLVRGDVVRVVA
jgi:L,D-transpeptidase-like protein